MPVNMLLVEGNLDQELLARVCGGHPVVEAAGTKNALAARVRMERQKGAQSIFYLRDRDYDTEPPQDAAKPTKDVFGDGHLGWRWCRHSIENYMLDPAIVCSALEVKEDDYVPALMSAARSLRYYQAARWTIGSVRCALPPKHELQTQKKKDEFYLPPVEKLDDKNEMRFWVSAHIETFSGILLPSLAPDNVVAVYTQFETRFVNVLCDNVDDILIWFSGKNLIAALKGWWSGLGIAGPSAFRNHIRDWMRDHPEKVLIELPEWRALLDGMRKN